MSMYLYEADPFRPRSVAQGYSTLEDVVRSQFEAGKLTDNINSRSYALTRAYDERIAAIRDATGETHVNPFTTRPGRYRPGRDRAEFEAREYARSAAGFNDWLTAMEKRHPEAADVIRAGEPVEDDAKALARNMDEEAAKTFAAARGPAKWLAMFGGRAGAMFNDPIQTGALVFGGGAGAARTVTGRILTTAASEALVNAAVQTATEPFVQRWRAEAGLESGWGEAAKNVAFAGLFGAALGGAGRAGAEGLAALGRSAEARAAARRALANDPATPEASRRALAGDREAAAAVLEPMRANLPAEARGALDALEGERLFGNQKPPAARSAYHDSVSANAIAAAQENRPFRFEPDTEQVRRIVDQLAPETTAPARTAEQPIDEFLMRRGGVKDYKGEMAALGLDKAARPFVGRLVREGGDTLDNARLAAAEAGYFDHLYGTADQAAEKSTIGDLLDALDNASRTQTAQPAADTERRAVEGLVHDIIADAGPGVDDAVIIRAAERAVSENLPARDALARTLEAPDARPADAGADDLPQEAFFPEDEISGGLDDPRVIDKEDLISRREIGDVPEDMEIPFFDDEGPVTIAALNDELERIDRAARIVEACPL
ncbi:hypothetical protein [Martelella mangrovi]|uniref:DdrB-like domain-containing protein n=1 Tax=Martelella mangrovi TaxID=1397477 RepID=A0ABV2IFB2_9HYPH